MKKKIILTESQYNRLQELLFENKYDNIVAKLEQTKGLEFDDKLKSISKILGTKDEQQTYDTIESITSKPISDLVANANTDKGMEMVNSLISAYQQKSQAFNQKQGQKNNKLKLAKPTDINHILDFTNVGDDLKFKTSQNTDFGIKIASVNQTNNEILGDNHGNKIRMSFNAFNPKTKELNYLQLDKNTQKYINKTANVIGLEIIRNGKPLEIPLAGNGKKKQPVQPTQPNTNDEEPHTVELDPNQTNLDDLKKAGEEARYKIDYSKDPLLKKAFHRQPGFWDQFKAELKGEKSEPNGIKSVLDILGKYTTKAVKDKFGDVFVQGQKANFKILTRTSLAVKNADYSFIVRNYTEGDIGTLTLTEPNKQNPLRLVVKDRKKDATDVYICTLKHLVNNKEEEENVEVMFSKSAGYTPTPPTNKTPINKTNK